MSNSSSRVTLLCSAQQFGFGPIAELNAVITAVRRLDGGLRIVIHEDPLLSALRLRRSYACEAALPSHEGGLKLFRAAAEAESGGAVFSSYDSEAVFTGWYHRLPTFFYDALGWFWSWESYKDVLQPELLRLAAIREREDEDAFAQAYYALRDRDYHLTVLVAYHLAHAVYAKRGAGLAEQLSRFPHLSQKVIPIGAVIDKGIAPVLPEQRSHMLVSLSGSLAPLITLDQNVLFARGALQFALDGHTISAGKRPWIFVSHPAIHSELAKEGRFSNLPRDFTAIPSVSYEENLCLIGKAHAMFASPGFTSIQEAAMLRTPLFFLPEQNGGQPPQFQMVRDSGYDVSRNWTVTHHLHGGECRIGENDIAELYRAVSTLWGSSQRARRIGTLREFLKCVETPEARQALVSSLVGAVTQILGDFDGADRIAADLCSSARTGWTTMEGTGNDVGELATVAK